MRRAPARSHSCTITLELELRDRGQTSVEFHLRARLELMSTLQRSSDRQSDEEKSSGTETESDSDDEDGAAPLLAAPLSRTRGCVSCRVASILCEWLPSASMDVADECYSRGFDPGRGWNCRNRPVEETCGAAAERTAIEQW